MKLDKIKEVAAYNLRKFGIFRRHLLRCNIDTQFVTQNVKITFSVQTPPTHPWKRKLGPNIFFVVKHRIQEPLETEQLQISYQLYLTKLENTTLKITKYLTSFHTLYSTHLLYWSVWGCLRVLFQEVLIGILTEGNFETTLNLDLTKFKCTLCVIA